MPLAETQEGNTIQDPQCGQWITVTRTAEGTTSVIHKYSDGARRTCFPNRLPTARATTPSSNERFKDKRTNGEWFRSCVLAHPREIHQNREFDGIMRQEQRLAIIGYARVSTIDQNPQLQLDALQEAGATRIYTDHGVSGATAYRPHLDACMDHLREGDVLTVWKLDRLGRNTQHVLAVVDELTSRGIGFRSLTEGLHTEGPMGTAMLTIMAAFAQLERDTMIERTRAGLAAAAANGRKGGRPRKVDDADAAKARQLREKGITATDIAKMLGVSRATVYRYLADDAAA